MGEHPLPVPVPDAGVSNSVGVPIAGFIFSSNTLVRGPHHTWVDGPDIHTTAQANEAGYMQLEMEETLCKAATGEPCPV
jgi:hypothetical protein